MKRSLIRTGVASVLATALLAVASGTPAYAAVILSLDPIHTAQLPADLPEELRDCTAVPGGAAEGSAGWIFDQPVEGDARAAYAVYFTAFDGGWWLIGVNPDGVFLLDPEGATQPQPAPDGVTGALIARTGGGYDGAWMRVPEAWFVAAGSLQVQADATAEEEFHLTGVCVDVPASPTPTPTPSPSKSASPSPSAVPSKTTPAPSGTGTAGSGGGTLPITGAPTAVLPLVGLALVMVGALLMVRPRRRGE